MAAVEENARGCSALWACGVCLSPASDARGEGDCNGRQEKERRGFDERLEVGQGRNVGLRETCATARAAVADDFRINGICIEAERGSQCDSEALEWMKLPPIGLNRRLPPSERKSEAPTKLDELDDPVHFLEVAGVSGMFRPGSDFRQVLGLGR